MKRSLLFAGLLISIQTGFSQQQFFTLNKLEYFERGGVNVMAFQDIYPEGHQGGVAVIMHGKRLATNGDIRLDFPELLDWPYLWQQQEYVMGGGATNFMFLVLAAENLLTAGLK